MKRIILAVAAVMVIASTSGCGCCRDLFCNTPFVPTATAQPATTYYMPQPCCPQPCCPPNYGY